LDISQRLLATIHVASVIRRACPRHGLQDNIDFLRRQIAKLFFRRQKVADDIRTLRTIENLPVLRGYAESRHKAKSWDRERRTVARIEATTLGLDIRFVVTSLDVGSAERIYDNLVLRARPG
jgi:Transposase DDE domain group 1